MITQEQAERAVELLKEVDHYINGNLAIPIRLPWIEQRIQLLAEIEANEPTATATQAQNWTAIKAKTNGDKWRSMTDEQIGSLIDRAGCCICPVSDVECGTYETKEQCIHLIVKWLKQEAKESGQ